MTSDLECDYELLFFFFNFMYDKIQLNIILYKLEVLHVFILRIIKNI